MDLQTNITYACLVVEYCLEFGFANELQSVDLHLVEVVGDTVYWICEGYPRNVGSGDYFTVQNSSVLVAYGYDLTIPAQSSAPIDTIPETSIPTVLPPLATSPPINIIPPSSLKVLPSSAIKSSTLPVATGLIPTTNRLCGSRITCLGWSLGDCCSAYGYCGNDAGYCGTGCQSTFGICGLPSSAAPPASLSSSAPVLPPSATPTTISCIAPTALAYHNCAATFTPSNSINDWGQLFYGSCATEDSDNPGNTDAGYPAETQEYAPGPIALMQDVSCSILDDCLNWADAQEYGNVDLHLLQDSPSEAHWECVAYCYNAGGDYFDITNVNVLLAFGYDFDG